MAVGGGDSQLPRHPHPHPAPSAWCSAKAYARRRQERRRHQHGARRAGDGVHAPPHQRVRHRRRRQRLHVAGREAEAVRQEGVHRRRTRVHQRDAAEELPRVHRVRKSRPACGGAAARDTRGAQPTASLAAQPIAQAFPLVKRALKVLAEREVTPQTGLLKSTLLQLDSTFSERNYGSSSFRDFTEKLVAGGPRAAQDAGRSVMVELNPGVRREADEPVHRRRRTWTARRPASTAGRADAVQASGRRPTSAGRRAAGASAATQRRRRQVGDILAARPARAGRCTSAT